MQLMPWAVTATVAYSGQLDANKLQQLMHSCQDSNRRATASTTNKMLPLKNGRPKKKNRRESNPYSDMVYVQITVSCPKTHFVS
jgi:hypothetical protein